MGMGMGMIGINRMLTNFIASCFLSRWGQVKLISDIARDKIAEAKTF